MRNKKRISILAVVLAFAIIFTGAFAFFSDSSMFDDSAKVGTFDIEVIGGLTHSKGLNNLNPGDNDFTVPEGNRNGSDHELSFTINNLGSKSAMTRAVISVYGFTRDGQALTEEDLTAFGFAERATSKTAASDDDSDKRTEISFNDLIEKHEFKDGKAIYIVGNNNDWVLNGTEETESVSSSTSLSKTFDVIFAKEIGNPSSYELFSDFEGATIHIDIEVQAIQYRNTGDPVWETIFTESTTSTTGDPQIVKFNFVTAWDDDNNSAGVRPDSVTVLVYGVSGEQEELVLTQTLSAADDLNEDDDPNTWEHESASINTRFTSFRMVKSVEDENYEITENVIFEAPVDRATPLVGFNFEGSFVIKNVWVDNDNALGKRPEELTFNIYGSDVNDESTKELFATVKMTETEAELIYLHEDYDANKGWLIFEYENWDNAFAYVVDDLPPYLWLEEVDVPDGYTMSYDLNTEMEYFFTVTNTLEGAEEPEEITEYNAFMTYKYKK